MFQPSILLTGATGLFGRACLPHLIARHGAKQILALVRRGRDTSELAAMAVGSIEVDLCAPNLGLSRAIYRSLAQSAKSIIHAAADIRFGIPLADSRRVNVLGTENLLRFAGHCSRLERFAQISTVYVWGGKAGELNEEAAQPGPFFNSYQQTKFEAEQVTLAAMATVPAGYLSAQHDGLRRLRRARVPVELLPPITTVGGDKSAARHSGYSRGENRSDHFRLGSACLRFYVCERMAAG